MFQWPWTRLAKENTDLRFELESANELLRVRIAQVDRLERQCEAEREKQLEVCQLYKQTIETLQKQSNAFSKAFLSYDHSVVSLGTNKASLLRKLQNDRCVFDTLLHIHESRQATLNAEPPQ